MIAHFYDIDSIVTIDNQAWVVDKNKPNIPIMKITKSDFNLIMNGIYKSQGNKIEFNGKTFWLPNDLINTLKIKAKNYKSNFGDLVISLQEFMNKDLIQNLEFYLNLDVLSELKNKTDDIYIICSKQTRNNYEPMIIKLIESLKEEGILIKNFYYINDNFYNHDADSVKYKKMRLLIQHLLGYKTEGNKFIDDEIVRYDKIQYYDNNYDTLKLADDINSFLEVVISNTDYGLRDVISENIQDFKPLLEVTKINDNLMNRYETKKVYLTLSRIIKTFESYTSINEALKNPILDAYLISDWKRLKIELNNVYDNEYEWMSPSLHFEKKTGIRGISQKYNIPYGLNEKEFQSLIDHFASKSYLKGTLKNLLKDVIELNEFLRDFIKYESYYYQILLGVTSMFNYNDILFYIVKKPYIINMNPKVYSFGGIETKESKEYSKYYRKISAQYKEGDIQWFPSKETLYKMDRSRD